ncbi:hypothetical protein LUZ63_016720 [Rhynchospora breviuscula]|uniref:ABC transporter domain-containing protein n=1 Tax=Rhynchospora breviuscula TaxID=2022672 RepID=A0A9P9ZAE1_9POAL|nr:hypothetical protein LUZ63_016720 [Rhynchospora breviuscula]
MENQERTLQRSGSSLRDTSSRIEGSGLQRTGSWLRATSARSSAFIHLSKDEDDEEDLKWAALEKLPTFARARKGILKGNEGETLEVDVEALGNVERKMLMDQLMRATNEDNEKFFRKMKNRLDTVGIEMPTIEVRYQDLKIHAEAYVGGRALPSIANYFLNKIEGFLSCLHVLPSKKRPITILDNVSGIIKPGRLTLLLGPPGSGKTSLLLALAGKLASDLKVSGEITYNGHKMNEFVPERTSAYISQHDTHIGEMTVRETLNFSAKCQGVGTRYDMLLELVRREKEANLKPDPEIDLFMKALSLKGQENVITDYILKILGLDVCADTLVGDEMLRGISGGQKKRLTIGEMIVGPSRALFMDEISNGLDSSTTFQIVKSIRQATQILGGTTVVALLQPAPETYELFDDILLLSEGWIVYQGPRGHVLEFFELMGFKCPERKDVADFLQEVTSRKDQQQYWVHSQETYKFIPVSEFSNAFWSFHVGRSLSMELSIPFDKSKNHPAALTKSKYGIGKKELLKACFKREFILMKRNSFVYIFKLIQIFLSSILVSTVFLRTQMHHRSVEDGIVYMGVLFQGLSMHTLYGLLELAMTVFKLPVFFKQRDFRFFPAWAYAIPTWLLKIPVTFVECAVYVFMTYYTIGCDPNIQRMFRQLLIFTLMSQIGSSLFRLLGACGREQVTANTYGSFAATMLFVFGGFILSRKSIKVWWAWASWATPFMYAYNAVVVNEFLGHNWRHVINSTVSTETLGVQVIKSHDLFHDPKWYWIGVGALIGFLFIYNLLYAAALSFLNPIAKGWTIVDGSDEKLTNRTEDNTSTHKDRKMIKMTSAKPDGNTSEYGKKKGMVLPFPPLSIVFEDIKYSVDMPKELRAGVQRDRLMLLKGASGAFRPGVLTALMGVTGAGKTTLMDVLAGRKTGGYIEGNISISGYPKKAETFARISGYCEQNDIHSPNVTVLESLIYSAWLRLPKEIDSKSREMFIEEMMELVELTSLRNALVGLPMVNGLSTEQRKRLTIAVELVANPSIIFMDEPTSGLDARAAAIVMRTIRNTVNTGRTVVCTIHQPSIDIFDSFDEVFLMKRGGEEIYFGPIGHKGSELINYFESIPGISKIKDGYNPATWMLEVSTMAQEAALGINFTDIYHNSELYRKNKALIAELSTPPPGARDLRFPTRYSQSFLTQCLACLWKQHNSYWRNPSYNAVRFVFTIILALLMGTIFWKLGGKRGSPQQLFNAMGSMYTALMFMGMQNSQVVLPVVDTERTVFYREKFAGMYSALPYAAAQVIIEIPYTLAQAIIYSILTYSMLEFQWTLVKFFWYSFFTFFTLLCFSYYGIMISAVTPNAHVASVSAAGFYCIWNIFAGFVIPQPRLPTWYRWYFWVCPVSWALYGLMVSQFGDVNDIMDNGISVKDFIREYFGYNASFLPAAAIAIVGFTIIFATSFAFAIKTLNFQKR